MAKLSFDYAKVIAHPRFRALVKFLGDDEDRALGCLLRFWNVAQEYWGDGRRFVPNKIFYLDEDFPFLIETDFAECREEKGVYAKGAENHFEWFASRREAAHKGGVASAAARKSKSGSAQPQNPEANPNQVPKQTRTKSEVTPNVPEARPEPNPNPSISSSTSISVSTSASAEKVPAAPEAPLPVEALYEAPEEKKSDPPNKVGTKSDGAKVFEAYREAYHRRYGVDPVRNAKTNSQCTQLVKRLGLEAAERVVRFYLTHGKGFYVQTSHGLGPCVADAEGLWTQCRTGSRVTQTQARKTDEGQANQDVFERLAKKWADEDEHGKLGEAQ